MWRKAISLLLRFLVACNFLKIVLKLLKTYDGSVRPKHAVYMILNNYKYTVCCGCSNGLCRTKFRHRSASNAMINHEASQRTVKFQAWCFLCTTSIIGPILFAGYKSTPTLSVTHFWDQLDTCPITTEYKLPVSNTIQQLTQPNIFCMFLKYRESKLDIKSKA